MINLTNELIVLSITGEDSTSFLQGQTTNDINLIKPSEWQFSSHLNHKGRILAIFIIYKINDNHYLLITDKSITDNIIKRLKMFILRSKVQISQENYKLYFCSIEVKNIDAELKSNELVIDLDNLGNKIIVSQDSKDSSDNINIWNKYLIDNKVVFINQTLEGLFIPQHIEFTGVSYTKGCYTGQEIVARTHYLGKSKKSLSIVNDTQLVEIGQELNQTEDESNKSGVVLNRYHGHDHYLYLICD
jgi:folate-binding protein YgfZ